MLTAPTKEEVLESTRHEGDDIVVVDEKKGNQSFSRLRIECGDCFGAKEKTECCNTCEELIDAYRKKNWDVESVKSRAPQCAGFSYLEKWKNGVERGCRLEGKLSITKVQGHIFIIPGRINDLLSNSEIRQIASSINVTHTIHHFSLGEAIPVIGTFFVMSVGTEESLRGPPRRDDSGPCFHVPVFRERDSNHLH